MEQHVLSLAAPTLGRHASHAEMKHQATAAQLVFLTISINQERDIINLYTRIVNKDTMLKKNFNIKE